jgi:hypothetical protein
MTTTAKKTTSTRARRTKAAAPEQPAPTEEITTAPAPAPEATPEATPEAAPEPEALPQSEPVTDTATKWEYVIPEQPTFHWVITVEASDIRGRNVRRQTFQGMASPDATAAPTRERVYRWARDTAISRMAETGPADMTAVLFFTVERNELL